MRGRPPLVKRTEVVLQQPDVELGAMYQAVLTSDLPQSEKDYLININIAMNQRSLVANERRTDVEELKKLFKAEKARLNAELKSTEAYIMLQESAADLDRAEAEYAVLCNKYMGFCEMLRMRQHTGEHVPQSVQNLLRG